MFWAVIWKYQIFLSENFHFLVVKFSVYLNRHAFVMVCGVCGVLICSSFFLPVVPGEGCASWFWYFLGIFTSTCICFITFLNFSPLTLRFQGTTDNFEVWDCFSPFWFIFNCPLRVCKAGALLMTRPVLFVVFPSFFVCLDFWSLELCLQNCICYARGTWDVTYRNVV